MDPQKKTLVAGLNIQNTTLTQISKLMNPYLNQFYYKIKVLGVLLHLLFLTTSCIKLTSVATLKNQNTSITQNIWTH